MTDNVLIAIAATCSIIISVAAVLGGAIFAWLASNKRLDKIEATLSAIQSEMRQFFRVHLRP